jgi:hypothetical protein
MIEHLSPAPLDKLGAPPLLKKERGDGVMSIIVFIVIYDSNEG